MSRRGAAVGGDSIKSMKEQEFKNETCFKSKGLVGIIWWKYDCNLLIKCHLHCFLVFHELAMCVNIFTQLTLTGSGR